MNFATHSLRKRRCPFPRSSSPRITFGQRRGLRPQHTIYRKLPRCIPHPT
jgi:hypothetical protein